MPYRMPFIVAALTLLAAACDKSNEPSGQVAASPQKAPRAPAIRKAATEPLTARGEVDGLQWKHEFDGNQIDDITRCGERIYTATRAGRVVEWHREALVVERTVEDFGAVTSVDGAPDGLLIATKAGRLSTATCDLKTVEKAPRTVPEVQFAQLDPRSKTRVLAINLEEKKSENFALGSLIDLRTGKAVHPPFATPQRDNATPVGFVDYKGELWLGLSTRKAGSKLWYLERFDVKQQGVTDLGVDFEILGLTHVKRQVWAYGARDDRSAGFITRVDSGRSQVKWDGFEAWFGAPPGGDVPTRRPVTYLVQSGEQLLIFVPDAIYRADLELRRWKRLIGPKLDGKRPFQTVGGHVTLGDKILVGSTAGLVEIHKDEWELITVPTAEHSQRDDRGADSVEWRGTRYEIKDRELRARGAKLPRGLSRAAAVAVDPLDRLWIVSESRVYLIDKPNDTKPSSWELEKVGIDARAIVGSTLSAEDAVGFRMADGSAIHFRVP